MAIVPAHPSTKDWVFGKHTLNHVDLTQNWQKAIDLYIPFGTVTHGNPSQCFHQVWSVSVLLTGVYILLIGMLPLSELVPVPVPVDEGTYLPLCLPSYFWQHQHALHFLQHHSINHALHTLRIWSWRTQNNKKMKTPCREFRRQNIIWKTKLTLSIITKKADPHVRPSKTEMTTAFCRRFIVSFFLSSSLVCVVWRPHVSL